MTDYDIRASSLVLVRCLAKRERTINRRVKKRSDVEQFHHFGSVFVKEDRETGKVVQKPCLFVRQNRAIKSNGLSLISEPVTYQWGGQGGPECTSPRGPVTYQWRGQGGPECTSPRGPVTYQWRGQAGPECTSPRGPGKMYCQLHKIY